MNDPEQSYKAGNGASYTLEGSIGIWSSRKGAVL